MAALSDITVLDFSTLLPGPLATLMLAEAGARVIKIERPEAGDAMRGYEPIVDGESVLFAMLNRGKQSVVVDLKSDDALDVLTPVIRQADVVVEQFRPGVMERLGLGYDMLRHINPGLVYCSITGWGQTGAEVKKAGHDLNFQAEAGSLGLSARDSAKPSLPTFLAGDIAGGALPAVINILLALKSRNETGQGCHIDVSMTDNLLSYASWGLSSGLSGAGWPQPGQDLVTGGSARYQIYRTADDRFLAVAPIEDKFWVEFTRLIQLPTALVDASAPTDQVVSAIANIIAGKTAEEWQRVFAGHDVCCSVVLALEEAVARAKVSGDLFSDEIGVGAFEFPALPVPLSRAFRSSATRTRAPSLGEDMPSQGHRWRIHHA